MWIKHQRLSIGCVFIVYVLFGIQLSQAKQTRYPNAELKSVLEAALKAKGKAYHAKTTHLLANGQPKFVNRLILEDSPYLLQHAHNPVNWYTWGDEAFATAKRENKPVFLSIGYSTCFWCHVMARESFEDPAIAKLLNKHFISIKVDRERHPDVDALYMAAVTLITGSGGWPMSGFLTPDGKTFLGGTYLQPDKLKSLLVKVAQLWRQQPQLLAEQAEKVSLDVAQQFASRQQVLKIDSAQLAQAVEALLYQHDRLNGGFGYQAKFPYESRLLYLLEYALRFHDANALRAVDISLQAMAQGGIYDHIGGGFHRYATDDQWRIPHFEKMLYNQAQLSRLYLLAYQGTGAGQYARIATETLDYVLEELTADNGGFYSATDADGTEGEGDYFLWTARQFKQVLAPELADPAIDLFGLTGQGNFEGKNVLHLRQSLPEYAKQHHLELAKLEIDYQAIKTQLKKSRQQRPAPFKDTKILTAWNAMMIQSLAIAGDVLGKENYLIAAKQAADLIWANRDVKTGRLWRVYWQSRTSIPANQEDYAYYAQALIQLHDVTGEAHWLARAQQVTQTMLDLFWDMKQGGFFMNTVAVSNQMLRPKAIKDNETASANAVAMQVLSQLSGRTGNPDYAEKAKQLLAAFSGQLSGSPIDYAYLFLAATDFLYGEQSPVQYAAKSAVTVRARSTVEAQEHWLELEIDIKPGWHINARKPLQPYLLPTEITIGEGTKGWQLTDVNYPEPVKKKLGFQREELALYENRLKLRGKLIKSTQAERIFFLKINLQACDEKVCLPPEALLLRIPVTEKEYSHP